MSYLFDGVDDNLLINSAVDTAAPVTLACWFKVTNITANHNLMCVVDKDVDTEYFVLTASGAVANDPVRAGTSAGASTEFAVTSAGYTADTWHHGAAVFASATDRRAFLNGGSKGTATTSLTPTNLDRTAIGRLMRLTPGGQVAGRIAYAGIWNAALTDAEVALLAAGALPTSIQSASLVAYWPLVDDANDDAGSNHLTATGAVVDADNPSLAALAGNQQTIDGFGCSTKPFDNLDLFGGTVAVPVDVTMTEGEKNEVLDALYADSGLKLTRERPLVRGTTNPVPDYRVEPSNDDSDPDNYNAAGFQFSRIDAHTATLTAAKSRGLQKIWFSPVTRESWMTVSSGSATDIAEYAEWLLAMARRMDDNGQPADFISVGNEPTYTRNTLTGAFIREVIKEYGPRAAAENLTTELVMPDDIRASDAAGIIDTVMADPTAASYVTALATHPYDEALSNMSAMQSRAETHGVPWWMTEISTVAVNSTGLDSNPLTFAGVMHDLLATYDCSAIDYLWGFFGEEDSAQLVRLDHTGTTYDGMVKLKVYYYFGQYSRHIDPGSTRVPAMCSDSNVKVSAYKHGTKRVVVAVNSTAGALTPTLVVPDIDGLDSLDTVYRTSGNTTGAGDNWLALTEVTPTGDSFAPTLAASSVTTFVGEFPVGTSASQTIRQMTGVG